mgnify:CR=1 FL=1
MKIIEDKHNIYPMRVTCKKCNSVIELENGKDILVHKAIASPMFIYERGPYIYKWMCPLFKEFNDIHR